MSDLTRTRDHARAMADDPATTPTDAVLWGQLADEIDAYLTPPDTDALFPSEVTP